MSDSTPIYKRQASKGSDRPSVETASVKRDPDGIPIDPLYVREKVREHSIATMGGQKTPTGYRD